MNRTEPDQIDAAFVATGVDDSLPGRKREPAVPSKGSGGRGSRSGGGKGRPQPKQERDDEEDASSSSFLAAVIGTLAYVVGYFWLAPIVDEPPLLVGFASAILAIGLYYVAQSTRGGGG